MIGVAIIVIVALFLLNMLCVYHKSIGMRVRACVVAVSVILVILQICALIAHLLQPGVTVVSSAPTRNIYYFGIAAAATVAWSYGPGLRGYIKFTRSDDSDA